MNAFGIPVASSSGQFKPYLKYNAKSGRFSKANRTETPDGWRTVDEDIGSSVTFAADLANTRVGWLHFAMGQAPRKEMVKFGTALPPRPADLDDEGRPAFKAGFEFDVILQGEKVVREIGGNAASLVAGFSDAFAAYQQAPEKAQGKVPVLSVTETVGIKSKSGTNYQPKVVISGWIDRPALFDETPAAPQPAPAPVAVAAPAAATGGASGFGFG